MYGNHFSCSRSDNRRRTRNVVAFEQRGRSTRIIRGAQSNAIERCIVPVCVCTCGSVVGLTRASSKENVGARNSSARTKTGNPAAVARTSFSRGAVARSDAIPTAPVRY